MLRGVPTGRFRTAGVMGVILLPHLVVGTTGRSQSVMRKLIPTVALAVVGTEQVEHLEAVGRVASRPCRTLHGLGPEGAPRDERFLRPMTGSAPQLRLVRATTAATCVAWLVRSAFVDVSAGGQVAHIDSIPAKWYAVPQLVAHDLQLHTGSANGPSCSSTPPPGRLTLSGAGGPRECRRRRPR